MADIHLTLLDDTESVIAGDCRDVLAGMEPESIDAVVTDPPYEYAFMNKSWDARGVSFDPETWRAVLRVLKPGGHLLAFGGARTYHRMTVAIEDAGFEIRDCLSWLYGSGMPKGMDLSKAFDRAAGAERPVIGRSNRHGGGTNHVYNVGMGDGNVPMLTAPATDLAKQWEGWNTTLKPAWEPIVLARKPLVGTVIENVAMHGTGGINVDGCRLDSIPLSVPQPAFNSPTGAVYGFKTGEGRSGEMSQSSGRWPANVMLDETAAAQLDEMSGDRPGMKPTTLRRGALTGRSIGSDACYGTAAPFTANAGYDDSGGASRFFYVAKASRAERNAGLDDMPPQACGVHDDDAYREPGERKANHTAPQPAANFHPTVKPVALMRWLVRMVTPPQGVVLDPFTGSGTTGIAAIYEGFRFIGVEREPEYVAIARRRLAHARDLQGDDAA